MGKQHLGLVGLGASLTLALLGTPAAAEEQAPPIPPQAEAAPVPVEGGQYCYVGPHPVDTRFAAGPPWDEAHGQHLHNYPPFDMRLFAYRDGCYYFVGDPTDFGYRGRTYSYYGAHPIIDRHGGGWCFMIGGHAHFWEPWSAHFTVVGPWYYWHGPYDPFFWSYWPYYSFYYRSYYPRYYSGGRFYRERGGPGVAPPIRSVPRSVGDYWRSSPGGPSGAWGGNRPVDQGWRGTPPTRAPANAPPPRAARPPADTWGPAPAWGGGFQGDRGGRYVAPPPAGGSHAAPVRAAPPPPPRGAPDRGPAPHGSGGRGWRR